MKNLRRRRNVPAWTNIACAVAISLSSSAIAQSPSVASGPLEAERIKLLQRIHSMEKEHRIGTAPYLSAFSEIESSVSAGKSADEINKQIARLDAAISAQLEDAARKANPVHYSSSPRVSPLSEVRPTQSPGSTAGHELTTYCASVAQKLQEKVKLTSGLEGVHVSFSVDRTGNVSDFQFKPGSKRSVETDRFYSQLQSVKTVAPLPKQVSDRTLKLMLVCCSKHGLEVGLHDVDLGPYMADMNRKIKRAWFPQKSFENLRVKVSYVLGEDGKVSDLKVSQSSNNPLADETARKAIQNAASSFRPLPDGTLPHIDVDFAFDISRNSTTARE